VSLFDGFGPPCGLFDVYGRVSCVLGQHNARGCWIPLKLDSYDDIWNLVNNMV